MLDAELKRLRWQCRRGVKELDTVLCAYLEGHYAISSVTDQRLFSELLALEDDKLLAYFFSHHADQHEGLKRLVEKIRRTYLG